MAKDKLRYSLSFFMIYTFQRGIFISDDCGMSWINLLFLFKK